MKKKLLYIVLVWLAGIGAAFGQVMGKATLFGETDHSGIKVKFIAQSPSAKTDSVISANDGNYSINLAAGVYLIQFTKNGFEIIENPYSTTTVLTSNYKLLSVDLLKSSNILSGSIEGVLKKGWYIVKDQTKIDLSKKLIIEPGSKLFFAKDANLLVAGELISEGIQNDSIYFNLYETTGNSENKWSSLVFLDGHNALFKFCQFSNANYVFSQPSYEGTLNVSNSKINNNNYVYTGYAPSGIFVSNVEITNTSFNISNCLLLNNNSSFNIWSQRNKKYTISCNAIVWDNFYPNGNEISVFNIISNGVIENNIIDFAGIKLEVLNRDDFIYRSESEVFHKTYFRYNTIKNFKKYEFLFGSSEGGKGSKTKDVYFENNTLIGGDAKIYSLNTSPIWTFPGTKEATVYNNIFDCNLNVCNKNFWNLNFSNNLVSGTYTTQCRSQWGEYDLGPFASGQKITTNANGDSVDTYFNLFEDPKFLNGTAPYLAANSPAIGAGIDANGNPVNIGFDPTGTCLESYFTKPNPVITADTLSIAGLVHQGSGLLSDGVVMAVEKTSGKARHQKVSNGAFKLDSLRKSEYILYAIPNPVTVTGYLPTYYVNKVKLSEAAPLNLLGKIKDVDIYLAAKPSVATGNYAIQGRFSYADNNTDDTTVFAKSWFATSYTPASPIVIIENPCKNLPVVLYNSNNQLVQSTVTDLDGYFVFNNLTSGTYKAQGQRVNYTTENNGVVQVGNTTTETANLRLEQMLTGLEDENAGNMNAVVAYPNPFKDELQLKGYKGAISIHDLTGNLYLETTISENETIDASNWPSGFYLLKTGNKVQKIVKQD